MVYSPNKYRETEGIKVRNVGVALSQNTLQELANSMGIQQRVAEMSEANKAQLRYIQILKSTGDWQTDMGRTLVTPANALRIIKQQFTLLARAIGSVFIPIVMEVIPYIMVLTRALTALAQKIANLLGYKIADIDYSYISNGLGDISAGIEDIGDSAGKTTSKLNTMLAPFDELNVVQNQKDTSGGGSGAGGFGDLLDLPLPEYDALAGLTEKMNDKMEQAKQKLKDMIPLVAGLGTAFATWKIGKSIANFMTWWDKLSGAGKTTARIALGVSLIVTGATLKFSGDKDILSEEKLVQGIAKQIGGSAALGGGTALITKSIPIGVVIGGISMIHSGGKTAAHGDSKQGFAGTIEQLLGLGGVAGATFKMTNGNPTITLAVTALVTWANVLFEAADLAKMKPTIEELTDAISQTPWAVANAKKVINAFTKGNLEPLLKSDNKFEQFFGKVGKAAQDSGKATGKFLKDIDKWNQGIADFFTNVGNTVGDAVYDMGDKIDQMNQGIADFFTDIGTAIGDFVSDAPKKLGKFWEDTKTGFSNTWNNIKTSTSEGWQGIKNTITEKWTSAKNWLSNNIGGTSFWKDKFRGLLDGATSILNDLRNKFSNFTAKLKLPHITWDSNGTRVTGALKKILETLNLPTTLPKLSVSWYAEGGFPRDGEFFVANENGPEMVGKIGNRSAVANNDQIETSLTNALITALNNYDFGSGKSPTTIYIGNKKVYEGYGDYVNGENDRYGTNTIRI